MPDVPSKTVLAHIGLPRLQYGDQTFGPPIWHLELLSDGTVRITEDNKALDALAGHDTADIDEINTFCDAATAQLQRISHDVPVRVPGPFHPDDPSTEPAVPADTTVLRRDAHSVEVLHHLRQHLWDNTYDSYELFDRRRRIHHLLDHVPVHWFLANDRNFNHIPHALGDIASHLDCPEVLLDELANHDTDWVAEAARRNPNFDHPADHGITAPGGVVAADMPYVLYEDGTVTVAPLPEDDRSTSWEQRTSLLAFCRAATAQMQSTPFALSALTNTDPGLPDGPFVAPTMNRRDLDTVTLLLRMWLTCQQGAKEARDTDWHENPPPPPRWAGDLLDALLDLGPLHTFFAYAHWHPEHVLAHPGCPSELVAEIANSEPGAQLPRSAAIASPHYPVSRLEQHQDHVDVWPGLLARPDCPAHILTHIRHALEPNADHEPDFDPYRHIKRALYTHPNMPAELIPEPPRYASWASYGLPGTGTSPARYDDDDEPF